MTRMFVINSQGQISISKRFLIKIMGFRGKAHQLAAQYYCHYSHHGE